MPRTTMKILIVSPAPPNRFHRIRLLHIIKALSTEHEITGVFLKCQKNKVPEIISSGDYIFKKPTWQSYLHCLAGLPTNEPLEVLYCKNDKIRKLVEETGSQHDLIITKRLRAAQYIPKNIKTPVIIDSTDAMSLAYKRKFKSAQGFKKTLFWEEWKKYENYEKATSKKFKNWVVCSPKDARYLAGTLTRGTKVRVVPNVVDTSYYKSRKTPQKNTLMFSGLLGKHVNQAAIYYYLEKIHPLVEKKIPNVKLNIVGPKPPKKLQGKATKRIKITEKVPDIRPWIAKSSVVIVPVLIGTGTRNKILQAWAHERPVISTTTGAAGLSYKNGENILIANNPEQFAQSIFTLLTDTKLARELAKAGRKTVLESYSLKTMKDNYEKVIKATQ